MKDQELLKSFSDKKLSIKRLHKLEKYFAKELEGTDEFTRLAEIRQQRKEQEQALRDLKVQKSPEAFRTLNDLKMNCLHTKEGLERRQISNVVMSEGNFFRLINAFMYFASCTDKTLPLLDLGTREGWFLEFLAKAGYTDVQAIEICPEAVALAKNKGLKVIKMDAQKMRFHNKFGTITAIHVLEHCQAPKTVVANIYEALKKKGVLYLEIPLEATLFPLKSAHFSAFPEPSALFALFNKKWRLLAYEVLVMNKAGTKRNLRSIWRKLT